MRGPPDDNINFLRRLFLPANFIPLGIGESYPPPTNPIHTRAIPFLGTGSSAPDGYLKANGDTMSRFADYCEMTLLESKETVANSTVEDAANVGTGASTGTGAAGTVGLFSWIGTYGHTTTGVTGGAPPPPPFFFFFLSLGINELVIVKSINS